MSEDVKDLPMSLKLEWTEPDLPQGRELSADILPFSEFHAMHKRIGGRNSFKPKTNFAPEPLEFLRKNDPVMHALEDEHIFSSHSMEPEAILFLREAISMFKPQVVLELGAGISSLSLSSHQASVVGNSAKYVVLEQDEDHAETIKDLAEKAKIGSALDVITLPMTRYNISEAFTLDEKAIPCLDFDEATIHKALGGIRPDMIIIDGPIDGKSLAGASLAKTLTLPILSLYASEKAVYFMTGAYMDPEIFAMDQWQQSGVANIIGVKAAGNGIMVALAPIHVAGSA